jgi:hypothetical protein
MSDENETENDGHPWANVALAMVIFGFLFFLIWGLHTNFRF